MPTSSHTRRRATIAIAIASLTLPATATARPLVDTSAGGGGSTPQALSDYYGWGESLPDRSHTRAHEHHSTTGLVQPNPDQRATAPTGSLAGTTSRQGLRSPDAIDAARSGEIAKTTRRYDGAHHTPAAGRPAAPPQGGYRQATPANDSPDWPEIAFAGVVLLAAAGGFARVRIRRRQRVAA